MFRWHLVLKQGTTPRAASEVLHSNGSVKVNASPAIGVPTIRARFFYFELEGLSALHRPDEPDWLVLPGSLTFRAFPRESCLTRGGHQRTCYLYIVDVIVKCPVSGKDKLYLLGLLICVSLVSLDPISLCSRTSVGFRISAIYFFGNLYSVHKYTCVYKTINIPVSF